METGIWIGTPGTPADLTDKKHQSAAENRNAVGVGGIYRPKDVESLGIDPGWPDTLKEGIPERKIDIHSPGPTPQS